MDSDEALSRALVAEVPALRPVLEEHLEDNFGSLLSYLFLADVVRWMDAHVQDEAASIQSGLDFLERHLGDGESTWNLIGAGFLENVTKHSALYNMLRPRLKSAF